MLSLLARHDNGDYPAFLNKRSLFDPEELCVVDGGNFNIIERFSCGDGVAYHYRDYLLMHDTVRSQLRCYNAAMLESTEVWSIEYSDEYGDGLLGRQSVFFDDGLAVVLCGSSERKDLAYTSFRPMCNCDILVVSLETGKIQYRLHFEDDT